MKIKLSRLKPSRLLIFLGIITLVSILPLSVLKTKAGDLHTPEQQGSPIHPTFPFLDINGENVLDTGNPVSTMETCGACHDTTFIESHSFHVDVGLQEYDETGPFDGGETWDTSPGLFGKWNPIQYRYLSTSNDELLDLGTPEWLMTIGIRHVGGGPATTSKNGNPLTELADSIDDPQTHIVNHETGEVIPWDWKESGTIEMNCFLCHTDNPDNDARIESLHSGNFGWANTATLNNYGLIEKNGDQFIWNVEGFEDNGDVKPELINIQDPTNQNCGLCHGLVHDNVDDPLVLTGCSPERWGTITTGQIISPQRLSDSGMNLANKDELSRSWDIHAERLLKCTDCHYSLNNPLYYQELDESKPDHLLYDPRRVEIGEYLEKPLHQFARGDSSQNSIGIDIDYTMRGCSDCHNAEETHDWLPYVDRHMTALSCETCHIPMLYSSANQTHDWTVIHLDGSARLECRGVEGDQETIRGLLTGFEPVWLIKRTDEGKPSLSPYNLITSFFWVYGEPPRPVPLDLLKEAYLEDGEYHPGILLRFDENKDGILQDDELIIDNKEKEQFLIDRLSLLGLSNPRITGEVRPYSINHDVANGEWVINDCEACHSDSSRVTQDFQLASTTPGGVTPSFINNKNLIINGQIVTTENGNLLFQPSSSEDYLYILGKDNIKWVDVFGLGAIFITLAGICVHGGLRIYESKRNPSGEQETQDVYMYSIYERLWHWLQTSAIVILILTGLIIHKPDMFGFLGFRGIVLIHNVIAFILGVNAFLSLFYHLASGEIKQYLPRPKGFFDQSITQAKYYLQGIFKGENHPFEKTPEKKLNPLQQATYFAILNVLLPLQGITGLLIWGAQRWPNISGALGGLRYLAPIHSLIAWLFVAFIILHVYLTTTGYKPISGIKAMVMGWEEIEGTHQHYDQA